MPNQNKNISNSTINSASPACLPENLPGNSGVYAIHQSTYEEHKPRVEPHSLRKYSIECSRTQKLGELLTEWKGSKQRSWKK